MARNFNSPTQSERKLPQHVAIIMDGNRRYAKARGWEPTQGHDYAAMHAIEPIIERAVKLGIPYLTFWAFSTENWKRDKAELKALFSIFRKGLAKLAVRFIKKGAKMKILGDINKFPSDIAKKATSLVNSSKDNNAITVSFALNYGGREEILRAIKKIINKGLKASEITEEVFSNMLDTAGIPDPDLIVRTGGDQRLSGYLPWQAVYAELYFTKKLFPEYSVTEFEKSLKEYKKRDRRFGGNSTKK
jgi:undecaprenyl diphosphate synthase